MPAGPSTDLLLTLYKLSIAERLRVAAGLLDDATRSDNDAQQVALTRAARCVVSLVDRDLLAALKAE